MRHSANSEDLSPKTAGELGEFPLIARLTSLLPSSGAGVMCGVGDDAAVLDMGDGSALLFTTDALVEGRHFLPQPNVAMSPQDVGWRAIVASVSDIAAMGAGPMAAVCSVAVQPDTPLGLLDGVYEGAAQAAQAYSVDLVGGDTTSTSGPLVLSVAMVGRCEAETVLYRSRARPGDALFVTGKPGRAAGGLAALQEDASDRCGPLSQAFLRPHVRVPLAQAIAASRLATAMMDLSDGLAGDVYRLAESSDVGIHIEAQRLPIDEDLVERYGLATARQFAAGGGEDFELLLAAPRQSLDALRALAADCKTQLTVIGEVAERTAGVELAGVEVKGWDHFARQS